MVCSTACQVVLGEDFAQTEHFCDVYANTGCAAGEVCQLGAENRPTCATAGVIPAGRSCANGACVQGTSCFPSADERECRSHCHPDASTDECGGAYCAAVTTIDGVPIGVCLDHCDLAAPHEARPPFIACPASLGCALTKLGVTACFDETSTQKDGESCLSAECKLGLSCAVYPSGQKVCEPYCRVGWSDCPNGRKCGGFKTPLVVDGIVFGSCNSK